MYLEQVIWTYICEPSFTCITLDEHSRVNIQDARHVAHYLKSQSKSFGTLIYSLKKESFWHFVVLDDNHLVLA